MKPRLLCYDCLTAVKPTQPGSIRIIPSSEHLSPGLLGPIQRKCWFCDLQFAFEDVCLSCACENSHCQSCHREVANRVPATTLAQIRHHKARWQERVHSAKQEYETGIRPFAEGAAKFERAVATAKMAASESATKEGPVPGFDPKAAVVKAKDVFCDYWNYRQYKLSYLRAVRHADAMFQIEAEFVFLDYLNHRRREAGLERAQEDFEFLELL